jgi:hypothetical protein
MASNLALLPSSLSLESWYQYGTFLPPSRSLQFTPDPRTNNYLSSENWEKIRPIFTHLYIERKLQLKEIMELLADVYGFHAQCVSLTPLVDPTGIDQ